MDTCEDEDTVSSRSLEDDETCKLVVFGECIGGRGNGKLIRLDNN